jgi:CheY-like chemotaxis protein
LSFIVLAVEDDLQEQLVISRAVGAIEGAKLVMTDTGGEALDYIHRRGPHESRRPNENPCLVIADHQLPDMLAHDLVRLVREHPTLSGLPVFVYAEELNGATQSYVALGVDGPMKKPLSHEHFRTAVHDAVKKHLPAE